MTHMNKTSSEFHDTRS